jgi:hypothetical protein
MQGIRTFHCIRILSFSSNQSEIEVFPSLGGHLNENIAVLIVRARQSEDVCLFHPS